MYQTFQEFNNTNLTGLFLYPAEVVPIFIPMVLFVLFSIVLLGSYFAQKRLSGRGNFAASFAAAAYLITIIGFFMSLVPGLINTLTLVVCIIASVLGTLMLLWKK